MSPNKKGIMVPDKHWIIKTLRNFRFPDPDKAHSDVHPITSDEVSYDVWQKAHAIAIMFEQHGWPDQHLGRRVNNQVELFTEEGSEDYQELKECLEAKGLSVRPYVPPSDKSKRPKVTYKAVQGEGERTVMKEIVKNFKAHVQQTEYEKEVKVYHGFIAAVPGQKLSLAVVRVDEETFENKKGQTGGTIHIPDETTEWTILGEINNGEVKFTCNEEVTKSYFDGMGDLKMDTLWINLAERKELEALEQCKKEKKAAKKHRRAMTTSTSATTPSEVSVGSRATEEEEAIKARQRAKNNEKRKKRRQRKRVELVEEDEEEVESRGSIAIEIRGPRDHGKDSDSDKSQWEFEQKLSNKPLYRNQKGDIKLEHNCDLAAALKSGIVEDVESEEEKEVRKPKVKLPKADKKKREKEERRDSVKEAEVEESEEEQKVIVVSDLEEARDVLKEGGAFWVVNPVDEANVDKGLECRYLGRGL